MNIPLTKTEEGEEIDRLRDELERSRCLHKEDFDKLTGYVKEYPLLEAENERLKAELEKVKKAAEKYCIDSYELAALRSQPSQQAESVYAFRRKGLDDFCTCSKERYDELAQKPNLFQVTTFYTAPPSEDARDAARYRTIEQERAEAEYQYITGAFDYETSPLGSRDWCLYWAGWLARSTDAMQKGGA